MPHIVIRMMNSKSILPRSIARLVLFLVCMFLCGNLYAQREITLQESGIVYENFENTDSVLIIHSPTSFSSNSGSATLILRNQHEARFKITAYCELLTSNAYLEIIKDSIIESHNKQTMRFYDTILDSESMYNYTRLRFARNNTSSDVGNFVIYISLVCLDNLSVASLGNNYAILSWDDYFHSQNNYTIVYNKVGSDIYDTAYTTNPGIQLNNIDNNSSYFVSVFDNYGNSTSLKFRTFCDGNTTIENDFSNLYSCNVTCKYGTFLHPDTETGIVDKGMFAEDTRHCVNIGIEDSMDARTNNQLRIIPYGENYSIRLGNWYWEKGEESITYKYVVDTLRYDLLLLKYAAVLQNPGHVAIRQPRFKFQILDEGGNEINASCYSADFVSNTDLGWNVIKNSDTILWKDWTTIGIDVAPLHGQTIYIKLSTFDCGDGLHYGYAYFILKEDFKNIKSDRCGEEGAREFMVPEGFNYRWYKEENPDNTLSNERYVEITEDGTYVAECYFVGAGDLENSTSCSFICKATAGARFPKADFTYRILERNEDNCTTKIQFYNNSFVTRDSLLTDITDERCENFIWDFGDGTFSDEISPIHIYEHNFSYDIKLTAFIGNNACSNEKDSTIYLLTCYNIDSTIANICEGFSYQWDDTTINTEGEYLKEIDRYHAKLLILHVRKNYDTILYREICSDEEYNGLNTSGIYIDSLQSEYGCDSIVTLNLEVFPCKEDTLVADICKGESYFFNGSMIKEQGDYIYQGLTANGCDSIVHLSLYVRENTSDSIYIEIFGEDIYEGYGFIEESSGFYTHYSSSYNGCDSVFTLHLIFHRNPIVWIPNAFTPNQESNNIFLLYPNHDVESLHSFEIFSRWGTKVFHTDDFSEGWNGTYKGKNCPQGAYIYKIMYLGKDNVMYEKSGEIMLLY